MKEYHSGQNLMLMSNKISKSDRGIEMVASECQEKREGRPSKFKAVQALCSTLDAAESKVFVLPQLPPRPKSKYPVSTDASIKDDALMDEKSVDVNNRDVSEEIEESPFAEPSEILKRLRAKSTLVPIGLHAILCQPSPTIPRRPQPLSTDKPEDDDIDDNCK